MTARRKVSKAHQRQPNAAARSSARHQRSDDAALPNHFPPDTGSDAALRELRQRFLGILDEFCPQARCDLHQCVWSRFRPELERMLQAALAMPPEPLPVEDSDLLGPRLEWLASAWCIHASAEGDPTALALRSEVEVWADKYAIRSDWVIQEALRLLDGWLHGAAEDCPWDVADSGIWSPLTAEERRFSLVVESAWSPPQESRQEAEERLAKEFRVARRAWFDKAERFAHQRGFRQPPVKPSADRHLRWLVRHQVLSESFTDIARSEDLGDPEQQGRKSVASGVRDIAKLIGLELRRPDRGGRPPEH